jgi:hypothetical protein
MDANRYGAFLYRFALSIAVWCVLLCLFYLLAGFNRASDGRLDSLFVEWLSGMEMHLTFLSPHVIGYHYIALALALVGPPLTSAWAIPLIPARSAPGRGDMDTSVNSTRPGAAKALSFGWLRDRDRRRAVPVPLLWGNGSALILWLLAYSSDLFGIRRSSYQVGIELPFWSPVWMFAVWSTFLGVLPGVVRHIIDLRATRHAGVT